MRVLLAAKTFHSPWGTGYVSYIRGFLKLLLKLGNAGIYLLSSMRSREYLRHIIEHDALFKYLQEFKDFVSDAHKAVYLEEHIKI